MDENKAIVRRYYEDVINHKNVVALEDIIRDDAVDHSAPPGAAGGVEGAKRFFGMLLAAFPDYRVTIEDLIAEDDKVVARLTTSGTHQGVFMGFPPTGKHMATTGVEIFRIVGGKVVEHWDFYDELGMMRQLGLVPTRE